MGEKGAINFPNWEREFEKSNSSREMGMFPRAGYSPLSRQFCKFQSFLAGNLYLADFCSVVFVVCDEGWTEGHYIRQVAGVILMGGHL